MKCVLSLIIALCAWWPCSAWSQSLVTDAQIAAAQADFDQGAEAFAAGDYARATMLFQRAYAQVPEAAFLYNAAKAYERMEKWDQALAMLARAEQSSARPLPPGMANKVPAYRARLEKARDAARAEQTPRDARRESEARAASEDTSAPTTTAPTAVPEAQDGMGAIGFVGVGAVVVGAGLGAWSAVLASSVSEENERLRTQAGQTPAQFARDREQVLEDQSAARWLLFGGAGLALVGVGLVAWDWGVRMTRRRALARACGLVLGARAWR